MSPKPPRPPTIQVRLNGTAEVQRAGEPPRALERKQAALLAWLNAHGPTPRARLAALLWPEVDEDRARANLRQRLSKLRAVEPDLLDDDGRVLALARGVVVAGGDAALLSTFDYADCEVFAQWLDGQRQQALAAQQAALVREVSRAIEARDFEQAQDAAQALLALDHESEDAHRLLMQALYLRGAYAEAITVWDRCRDTLRGLYGVPPSPATQALGELVLKASRTSREAAAPRQGVMPLTLLRPPQLVGRSRALDTLLAAWSAGQLLCVVGTAGLGKSRLLAELVAAVGGGVHVAARPGDALQPYAALGRLLLAALDHTEPAPPAALLHQAARLVPALLPLAGGQAEPVATAYERSQALQAAGQLLQACMASACPVLVFDDLHFADLASVEALLALLDPPSTPLRLAFGTRADEQCAAASEGLSRLVAQGRLAQVVLEPLGLPEVRKLLASLALPGLDTHRMAPGLRRRVGGNPAFLLESLKLMLTLGPAGPGLVDRLPLAPGIDAVVAQRLALLTDPARELANVAAVAGADFSLPLAMALLGQDAATLAAPVRELEQRQVLYGRRFVHDLVARSVAAAMPAAEAQHWHVRVAGVLQAQGAEPAAMASHWRDGGEWLQAGRAFRQAAQAAARALRPVECTEWLDAAAECLDRAGQTSELFDAIEARLQVSDAPDRQQRRPALMDRLDGLASTPEQELRALQQRCGWHADNGRLDGLVPGLAGMARALSLGLHECGFGFANSVAWQLALAGRADEAVQSLEQFRDWVQGQCASVQGDFHIILSGVQGFSDRVMPALASAQDAMALLRSAGRHERVLPVLCNIAVFRQWRGELDAARAALLEATALRDRMLGAGASLNIDLQLGAVQRDQGDYLAAHGTLTRALDTFRALAHEAGPAADLTDVVLAENHLADFWLRLGLAAEAAACLQADDAAVDLRFRARRHCLRLRMSRDTGPLDPKLRAQLQNETAGMPAAYHRVLAELELARCLQPGPAAQEFARLARHPVTEQRPGLRLHAALRAAQAELARNGLAQARTWLDEALGLAERCEPVDAQRSELWLVAAQVFKATGEHALAEQALLDAMNWVHRTAALQLNPAWRQAFLHDHPVHRALLAMRGATG